MLYSENAIKFIHYLIGINRLQSTIKNIIVLRKQHKPNPSWIKNLSSTSIPYDIGYFLSLGSKFYTNPMNKNIVIRYALVTIEEK